MTYNPNAEPLPCELSYALIARSGDEDAFSEPLTSDEITEHVAEIISSILTSLECYEPEDAEKLPATALRCLGGVGYLRSILRWRKARIRARFAGTGAVPPAPRLPTRKEAEAA